MWETSVTMSLTSIHPVSHGSGLDRGTPQDMGRERSEEGVRKRRQHYRDREGKGAVRMDQRAHEVLVR